MAVTRSANATWSGNLLEGKGSVSSETSQHLKDLPVSWNARTADPEGLTGPEELLAAAHASCFSMALSAGLGEADHSPESVETEAVVHLDKADDGFAIWFTHPIRADTLTTASVIMTTLTQEPLADYWIAARVPIVVRLDGTNAEEGRRILAEANHPRIVPAATMLEAAERAAELAREAVA